MKYPDGEIVTTDYNANMLPTNVSGTSVYVSSMTYDSAGRLLSRALGNGLTQTFNYYVWTQQGGRLHTLVTGALQNLTYQYDSIGNITQIANSVAGETSVYDYDALDRLTSWQLNQNSPETYTYDAQGNLDVKNGLNLNYNDANHKHAVTHIGTAQKYWYDDNGNQVTRIVGADTFDLAYDAENRLVEVKKNNVTISQFTYDGDGQRVKSVIDGETIRFVGGYYERKGSQITKYYMAGAARVAMRKYTIPQRMTVEYMLGDHLGSTSITTDANGTMISEMRYKPWGELRYSWTDSNLNTTPVYELTRYQYTGQYSYDVEFGLKYYGARFYDSAVGRFVSADSIIPQGQGTQAWDRFAYANNNPVRFNDPTGHYVPCGFLCSLVNAFLARGPDTIGIANAQKYTTTNNAVVAAGMAVQSQWYSESWDNPNNPYAGSYGPAQLMVSEYTAGSDPLDPSVATQGMQTRIDTMVNACTKCSTGADRLIVAAMAQNAGWLQVETLNNLPTKSDGTINWVQFLGNEGGGTRHPMAFLRQSITGMNYSTEFMLRLYMHDLQKLLALGYVLPEGFATQDDIDTVNDTLDSLDDSEEME